MLSNLSSDFPNAQESSERDHLLRPFVDREGVNLARIVGVEATPRAGYAGNALHGKTVVYIDNQMWFNPYVDSYDSSGHLWQNHIYWMTYRDRPLPDAQIAIYPFKREFVLGAAATDVQTGAATMCYLPDRNSPERETWQINMGAVDREFFTTNAMIRAARQTPRAVADVAQTVLIEQFASSRSGEGFSSR